MNYQIIPNASGGFDVLHDGEIVGSFPTREEALGFVTQEVAAALTELAAVEISEESRGARFEMEFFEGEQTVDRRIIDENAINFDRPPPLPVMLLTENGPGGHVGARLGGVVDETGRDGNRLFMRGYFDSGSDAGQEAQRLVDEGILTTWSPDVGNVDIEVEVTEEDEDGWPTDWLEHLTSGTMLGGTICPIPALTSARIRIIEAAAESEPAAEGDDPQEAAAATADPEPARPRLSVVAGGGPVRPPAEWFSDQGFSEPVPLTVTDDGRVFGHGFVWGTCHIGRDDICLTPPHSESDYAYYRTGAIPVEGCDCDTIATGAITIDTGHAPLTMSHRNAAAHYDNTGAAVADVACGEDEIGGWVAGALRPGVTDEQIRVLRASALSGDWRAIGGHLELVAFLAVNVPGFPVVRSIAASGHVEVPRVRVHLAQGHVQALVAAGSSPLVSRKSPFARAQGRSIESLEQRVGRLEQIATALEPQALDAMLAEIKR